MTDNTKVTKTEIIGASFVVYGAWEPFDGHGTIQAFGDLSMGRIGTRRLPAELNALAAGSDERYHRVGRWFERQFDEAYALIRDEVDPAGWDHTRETGGEIEVYG